MDFKPSHDDPNRYYIAGFPDSFGLYFISYKTYNGSKNVTQPC